MKEKTIVLSMDAMVGADIAYLKTKPNFSRLFRERAEIGKVCTIYPSITYPAHMSIMTGCRPGKHGVITNLEFAVDKGYPAWHLESKILQVEDIFAAAKRQGMTTASVYWPVCGNNPNIDYLINEFFFYEHEPVEETFASFGANEATLEVVRENMHRFPTAFGANEGKLYLHNSFDDFIMGCMCSLIRRHQPDLMLVHNCWMDDLRHRNGVFNDSVREGLDQTDLWLGEVIAALEDAGVYENTNFVLLSDHGQRDFARRIKINLLLRRGGFIDVDENGKIADWRALAQSNGMSATIFLKDPADEALAGEVYDYLKGLADQSVWGFTKIHTEAWTREHYGMYGGFAFMVESDGYTSFSDDWHEPIINPVDMTDSHRMGTATHGYQPENGPQPVFVARGPGFKAGAYLDDAFVIDEAPTIARMFGDAMPQAEGRVLEELLAEGR